VFKDRVIAEGLWNAGEDANNMWDKMSTNIQKVAIKVFGATRGNKREPKDIWWWNDDIQKTISEKKECYKRLYHHRSDKNIHKYKEAIRNTQKSYERSKGSDIYGAVTETRYKR
jgi:uncharacterized protein YaaR (DUF327 family)